jgi:hypothetical protein
MTRLHALELQERIYRELSSALGTKPRALQTRPANIEAYDLHLRRRDGVPGCGAGGSGAPRRLSKLRYRV